MRRRNRRYSSAGSGATGAVRAWRPSAAGNCELLLEGGTQGFWYSNNERIDVPKPDIPEIKPDLSKLPKH